MPALPAMPGGRPGDPVPRIERVTAGQTYGLRQRVLRPHQCIDEVGFPGDHDATTGHFAAFDTAGTVVGVVTVRYQASPGPVPESARPWRLRGMATAPEHRRQGVGRDLMAAALAHVAAHAGTVLWCQARLPAVAFYRRAGFAPAGEPWDEPGIGPHLVMWRWVAPSPASP